MNAAAPDRLRPERIGILGGTFDPLHRGHLEIARAAAQLGALDHVAFVPAYQSPHKNNGGEAGPGDRVEMVRRAIEGQAGFRLVPWELHRPGLSYSVDTARQFREEHPDAELFWIMGSDQWSVLESWHDWASLAALVTFIVFPRPDPVQPREGVRYVAMDRRLDISSTLIRDMIRQGLPWRHLVPEPVATYIDVRNLYHEKT